MEEGHYNCPKPGHHQAASRGPRTRRLRGAAEEIIEVIQGGHIMSSTGRKDRHSKVCTAKGPRDRRVRFSAHTAIRLYDVQDRLGYDRSSNAVDWLIKNAKAAIGDLASIPPRHQAATTAEQYSHSNNGHRGAGIGILPPSLNAIAYTINSLLPTSMAPSAYHNPDDLCLSLRRSFLYPIPFHQNCGWEGDTTVTPALSSVQSDPIVFDDPTPTAAWPDQNPKMALWATADDTADGSTAGCSRQYVFSIPAQPQNNSKGRMPVAVQSSFHCQRGPLQSSNSSSMCSWAGASFHITARIRGDEKEQDGIANMP